MIEINYNIYSAYYMNNDGRKEFVKHKLSFNSFQTLAQQYATRYNIYLMKVIKQ